MGGGRGGMDGWNLSLKNVVLVRLEADELIFIV
jgi:hypothetical protein